MRLALQRLGAALGNDEGALPVVAAIDGDDEVAGRHAGQRRCRSLPGSRPTRNQSTSIGAPTSSTARPAAARTVEWRPSQPIVQVGADLELALGRAAAHAGDAAVGRGRRDRSTSARMRSENAGSFLASSARKSRNSHCGIIAMKA